ncbi:MAG: ATP-dependent Clp protease adaptor ClpS [Varibaculum sp.]|nr:ATP-dependent Clp protease adaptor ClpS [Varibaculum sp.]
MHSLSVPASATRQWRALLWPDSVNRDRYVAGVLVSHFGLDPGVVTMKVAQMNRRGYIEVSAGPRERIEADVQALHEFGLQATMEEAAFPVEQTGGSHLQ